MYGAQNNCLNACRLSSKNAHAPVHACLCNVAENSLPWKLLRTYLESCASIVLVVVWRVKRCCLDEIRWLLLSRRNQRQTTARRCLLWRWFRRDSKRRLISSRQQRLTRQTTASVARRCWLKTSVQIHASSWRGRRCGDVQASFNHPPWCRPHPICLWFTLETWPRGSLHQ